MRPARTPGFLRQSFSPGSDHPAGEEARLPGWLWPPHRPWPSRSGLAILSCPAPSAAQRPGYGHGPVGWPINEAGRMRLWQEAWKKWPCSEGEQRRFINSTSSLLPTRRVCYWRVDSLRARGQTGQGSAERGRGADAGGCSLGLDKENQHQTVESWGREGDVFGFAE